MRRQRVLHRMRNLGDTGQADDARRALERMGLAQQARQRFRAGAAFFEAQHIAAEIGNDLARFDLKILVEIFVGHRVRYPSSRRRQRPAAAVFLTMVSAIELTFSSHNCDAPEPTASVACGGAPGLTGLELELVAPSWFPSPR